MENMIINSNTFDVSGKISSIELVKQINIFRKEEGNKSELKHNDLLKIIRYEFDEEIGMGKISHTPYTHHQNGQIYHMFILELDQAKQLMMRESKFVRKAMIQYIKVLEDKVKVPGTYIEALKRLVIAEEERLISEEKRMIAERNNKIKDQIILEYEPKVTYCDSILECKDAINISIIAKDYGMSTIQFNKKLHDMKIQYKSGDTWLLYKNHADKGYTKTKTTNYVKNNGENGVSVHTKWTQKGRMFLYNELSKYGIIPVIDLEHQKQVSN